MLAFFKLQKDSMVEYYKNINYLILLGNQSKINDPQLQVIWDRLKKVYPAVIEKNIYLITNSKIYSYPLKKYPRHYSIIRSLLLRRTRSRTKQSPSCSKEILQRKFYFFYSILNLNLCHIYVFLFYTATLYIFVTMSIIFIFIRTR